MPFVDHPVFDRPEANVPLWRYMELAKYIDLLARNALYFPTANRLGDPLEGSYPLANQQMRDLWYESYDLPLLRRRREQLARETLVSCWHMNERESAAMWEIYAREQRGIAIRTTFASLLEGFTVDASSPDRREMYAGRVRYIDFENEVIDESNHLAPFICKRLSYSYESEVRLVIGERRDSRRGSRVEHGMGGEYFPVDLSHLIHGVHVAPASKDWFREVVEAATVRFGLAMKVTRSELDRTPFI